MCSADAVKKWLVRELAQTVDISLEAVALDEPLSHFGLDSAKAVNLLHRLGEFLGRKIPATLGWRFPTIEALTNYLCGNTQPISKERCSNWSPATTWNQPIAIIGIGCRFPGGNDTEAFWESLRSGRSSFREIPQDRWNIDEWYDPDLTRAGKMNARMAGLLERIDLFDPGFFAISPREATQVDPQQRLALELTWEALEDAGVKPDGLRGTRTGVFVGVVWHDYDSVARKTGVEITAHSGTGHAFSIVANRVSYALGLQGPSVALDTACSSSLVAVHLACRSLQAGDASLAIAGGVNLIIDPETMVTLSKFGGLSPTSQLLAFDARANGFVRGEGGGFIVLKPLNKALAEGDHVYAVIRGTAVNNDGASNGLTAPNPEAQESVIEEAYARAGIEAAEVHYVEAHGTGTALGDPIEAQALRNVLGCRRTAERPLLIGSVKTNIGHLEGAAGIAGLIKLVLSIHHRQIPPSLNFETPNPHIDFAGSRLRVVTAAEPWPEPGKPAIGGVSAFGWGGTNCHLVVREPVHSTAQLLPLSAPDSAALKTSAQRLSAQLLSEDFALPDVCASAAARCAAGRERVALTARSMSELRAQLDGFLQGQKRPGVSTGCLISDRPKLAFVFSPQGSQWVGMGRDLMAVEPVFQAKLAECERALTRLAGWSLFDDVLATTATSRLDRAEFVQPVLFSIQVALTALWESWGVRPDFIAAHSLGEWAAACAAGALSVEEAMRVVVESSRAQARADNGGGMAVVELSIDQVEEQIRPWADEIFVAGSNSPTSTIISGDASRIESLIAMWKEEGLMCSLIDVDVAAHCPRVNSALDGLEAALTGLRPTRVAVPFVSSVTGDYLQGTEIGPNHWARHLRQPVLFTRVIERLVRDGCTLFLEISPHPLLVGGIRQTLVATGVDGVALSSCRRGDDERGALLDSLGALYALGWPIDWSAVIREGQANLPLSIFSACAAAVKPVEPAVEEPLLLPLSGHTGKALRDRARSVAHHIQTKRDLPVYDIAYTAAVRREQLEHRLAVVATRRDELVSALFAFADGQNPGDAITGRVRSGVSPKVAFVCSGQGPQWWGMGRELLESTPVFRREIARCAEEMKRHVRWDLLEELTRGEASSNLNQTRIAQPALFALQVALAVLWQSWGIEPHGLVGHSVGEVAAAYLGGILSFEDAVKVVCHRGTLMQRATGAGKMAALQISETEAEQLCSPYFEKVSIAAVNSPASTVVSGEPAAIQQIVAAAKARGIRSTVLPVDYAFHSVQMEPFRAAMAEAVSGLVRRVALIPIYSTVTGTAAAGADFDGSYWGQNIRGTVRFAAVIRRMLDAGFDTFVELSPHPVLSSMILECAQSATPPKLIPSLRQGLPERRQMLRSLAELFASGAAVNWTGVFREGGRVTPFPTYPWQRERYWLEDPGLSRRPGVAQEFRQTPCHGRRLNSPGIPGFIFEKQVATDSLRFIRDHRVFDVMIVPAPVMIEMALSAADEAFSVPLAPVTDLVLHRPLVLPETGQRIVHLVLDPPTDSFAEFKIHSSQFLDSQEPVWTLHATGRLSLDAAGRDFDSANVKGIEHRSLRPGFSSTLSADELYSLFEKRGVRFGQMCRVIERVDLGNGEAVASLGLPDALSGELAGYRLHPVLLDGALQTIVINYLEETATDEDEAVPWLFCGFDALRMTRTGLARLVCHSRLVRGEKQSSKMFRSSASLYDEHGELVAEIEGAQFRRASREALLVSNNVSPAELLFEVVWRPWSCSSHQLKRKPANFLPALEQIEERLQMEMLQQTTVEEGGTEVASTLHRLSATYASRAFQELGWRPDAGERFTAETVMRSSGILEQHSRLVARMLGMLEEEGNLRTLEDGWEVVRPWSPEDPSRAIRYLRDRFPDFHAELDLFDRCAGRLSEVLQGRCNPLQLLFPEGSLESASQVYGDSPMSRLPNRFMRGIVEAVVEALPAHRVLRVLEIGAGTGGTTAHLLPLLQNVPCEYVFTDLSKLFLDGARRKFEQFPFVRYALLDIEQNPQTQGFGAQGFDLIVAANVLHATRDLRQTLAKVRSMISPGGILALLEGFRPARWVDLVFGQTEGWWRFDDTELRPSHPLLSLGDWQRILDQTGFSDVRAVPARAGNQPTLFDQAVVIAKSATGSIIADTDRKPNISHLPAKSPKRNTWLIFGNSSPISDAVVRLLTTHGNEVVRIDQGTGFERLSSRRFQVDGSQPEQINRAISEGLAAVTLPCRHAVYLWPVASQEIDGIAVTYDQSIAFCSQALSIAKTLVSDSELRQSRLWLVTRGAQSPWTTESLFPAAASLWGVGRVLAVEQPEIWGGLLDLDPGAPPDDCAESIIAQVNTPEGENQCAFRDGARFVPRLVRQEEPVADEASSLALADGCYLISGGLGGVGLQIAQWLARRGARRLVLAGRTPFPERSEWATVAPASSTHGQIRGIREIEGYGAVVKTVAMDTASEGEIKRLLESLRADGWLPVSGVVHAAAVADDRLALNVDVESLQTVFRPKVMGALTLEKALSNQPLKFFICCSSVGALLGQTGQVAYAAANAFLDAFVQERCARKLPATGVNWGGWYGAGLAATSGGHRTIMGLEQRGILGFPPLAGTAALELLMQHGLRQTTVIRMDWTRFRQAYPAGEEPPLLLELAAGRPSVIGSEVRKASSTLSKPGLRDQLLAVESGAARRAVLEGELANQLAAVLKLNAAAIDVEKSMGALGLDSLLGFELKNRCEQSFGLTLSATMVWNYPTIAALTDHLAEKLGVPLDEGPAVVSGPASNATKPASEERFAAVINSVEQLSEDEALNALLRGERE
jgi:acyl transferase domain-containing protein/NAD(P)-dependent dehydrogenase (short-subunit alcohol dehydrogenase family)/SAM-dependent methyltransferase/acyl carrier protein